MGLAREPRDKEGVVVILRAVWALAPARGELPGNAGFKGWRAKQATVLLGNDEKKYFMAHK